MRHAADAATNASSDSGATPALLHSLHFFAHLLAAVSLTDRDDVLRVLSHLNSLVSRRADAVHVTVAASLGEEVPPPPRTPDPTLCSACKCLVHRLTGALIETVFWTETEL